MRLLRTIIFIGMAYSTTCATPPPPPPLPTYILPTVAFKDAYVQRQVLHAKPFLRYICAVFVAPL